MSNRTRFDREPFFIVGASRSGTTLFRLMLNANSRLVIPGETWFLTDLMDRFPSTGRLSAEQVAQALTIIEGHWRWREWNLDDELLRSAFAALDSPTLADVINTLFGLAKLESPDARWGDKTPGYTMEVERLHQVFPEAQFIHIVRDGRDVCLSLKKTGWHGQGTRVIAEYWASAVTAAHDAGRRLSPELYKEIAYEDLVLNTEEVLRSVCAFLRVEFEPAMLDFHRSASEHIPERAGGHLTKTRRQPRASDTSRWKNDQPRVQRVIFEAFAGRALQRLGYRRSVSHGLWMVRGLLRGIDFVAVTTLPIRRRLKLHFPKWRKAL